MENRENLPHVFLIIDHDFERYAKIVQEVIDDVGFEGKSLGMIMEEFKGTDEKGEYKKVIMQCIGRPTK